MVIHQFNKLIRNKWIWGVFAILVSVVFCMPDEWLSGRDNAGPVTGEAGVLGGEGVKAADFSAIVEDVRGFGRQRDWKRKQGDVNREAWETYAALKVADKNGIAASDAEVMGLIRRDPSFQVNGQFSFALYRRLLRENQIDEVRFEEYLRRRTTLMRLGQTVLGSAVWNSPMELDQAVADMTDVFTVKVARFEQDRKAADAIKLDEKGLRKWYDANTNSLALPERVKIRYVKFDATAKDVLAKMVVTEDELRDRYDVTVDKYTSTDTNGVETVKKFEEVKDGIEKEVRQIAAVTYFETNLNQRVYAVKAAKGSSRLDEIAKEDGRKVQTSDWFSTEGGYQEGFMRTASQILPGAKGFLEAVAELDPTTEDLRYAIVSSERAVWLIEKSETSPKHVPTFEEARKAIGPRALRAAKADAFKASIEAIAKQGAKAVLATKNVSTNLTFSVEELNGSAFEDAMAVAGAAMKTAKGEVSEFTLTQPGKAILVVCENRVPGDAAKAMVIRSQVRQSISMLQARQIPDEWNKWNLARMGLVPGDGAGLEIAEDEE